MILLFLALVAAPPEEVELPPCASKLREDISACDREVAAEKNSKARARLLYQRGYVRNERHDYEAAVADLNAAIAADPSFAMAYHERSYTYGELREFSLAAADADRDVALRPEEPDAYRERAFARHGLGNLTGAWEDRAKVAALEPKNPGAMLARGGRHCGSAASRRRAPIPGMRSLSPRRRATRGRAPPPAARWTTSRFGARVRPRRRRTPPAIPPTRRAASPQRR